ncbi:MAG: serine acetyltransferase [Clostridia bacterium]|nr:serine acetyltransferase [Clostridia bacterium]
MNYKEPSSVGECAASFVGDTENSLTCGCRKKLPDTTYAADILSAVKRIIYPKFFNRKEMLCKSEYEKAFSELFSLTEKAVKLALYYDGEMRGDTLNDGDIDKKACEISENFIRSIYGVYELIRLDVEATLCGDPAATSPDIILLCYPGVEAVFTYRVAHVLYTEGVPFLPRIMTEYAHSRTGIDIHPGAKIGKSFVIDHGTGVVIGETTVIGDRVKLYQGVTLGAKSLANARSLVGVKRHPTVEDDVTIYSGATILGGQTVIGKGAVIGSSVFITSSVPPDVTVAAEKPKLRLYKNNPLD